MVASMLVDMFLFGFAILLLAVAFIHLLWQRKRREDQKSYGEVLGEPSVLTYYSIESYTSAVERRHGVRGQRNDSE